MEEKVLIEKIKSDLGSGLAGSAEPKEQKQNNNKDSSLSVETVLTNPDEQKCLGFFLAQNYSGLLDYLYDDPSRIASHEIKALKFFAELKLGFKPKLGSLLSTNDYYSYKKDLVFSRTLVKQAKVLDIKDIDFFSFTAEIPEISYSWIKALLHSIDVELEGDLDFYLAKVEQSFSDVKAKYGNDTDVIEDFEPRILYLKALLHKNFNSPEQEKFIDLYLEKTLAQKEKIADLELIGNKLEFPEDKVLSNLDTLYQETKYIQNFIEDKTILLEDTCQSFACSDCCHYTHPSLSFTEFEYIKAWALENNYDLSQAIENAKRIQEHFKDGELKVIDKEGAINLLPEKPDFDCPFLIDKRCSIHEARPLMCRVFSTGTLDGKRIKSCHYYLNQYQYFSSPDNERLSYDARGFQAMLDASDKYLTQSDKAKTGLIAAYLLDYDENQ